MITAEQFLSGLGISPNTVIFDKDLEEYQYYCYLGNDLVCCILKQIQGIPYFFCIPYIPEKGCIDLMCVVFQTEAQDFNEKSLLDILSTMRQVSHS